MPAVGEDSGADAGAADGMAVAAEGGAVAGDGASSLFERRASGWSVLTLSILQRRNARHREEPPPADEERSPPIPLAAQPSRSSCKRVSRASDRRSLFGL